MIVRIHESENALADLARLDGLTKLPNRRAFDQALDEMFATMRRLRIGGALLMLDVDHFKRINDTHGHGAGDDVLQAVARVMSADTRLNDRIFRVGGEEFAVLMLGADETAAATAAERLRQAIAQHPFAVRTDHVPVTVSVGLAVATPETDSATVVEAADAALYRAKRDGRNRVAR
jgi:diguanylate cyclase (GGDEF)-like protein